MDHSRTVVLGATLTIDSLDAVARQAAAVEIGRDAARRLERAYAFVQHLARTETAVYGLTTGCGPLAGHQIPADRREEFQRNLVRSHAVTLGVPHPVSFV